MTPCEGGELDATTPGAMERVSAQAAGAPVEWEADVVLRDGTVAHVRPITPDDAEGSATSTAGSPPSRSTCASSRRCAS